MLDSLDLDIFYGCEILFRSSEYFAVVIFFSLLAQQVLNGHSLTIHIILLLFFLTKDHSFLLFMKKSIDFLLPPIMLKISK